MQVKNRLFPYPVINNNKVYSNYINHEFSFLYEIYETEYAYILKNARYHTDSFLLDTLISEDKVLVSCIVECSNTVFRKSYKLSLEGNDITLLKSDFDERVDISIFATATQDIQLKSLEFDSNYSEITFDIEKYDILGANDGFNIHFKHEETEESLSQSIFTIITSRDLKDSAYTIECGTSRKIIVTLSEKDYQNYKLIYSVPTYTEVFFNMLLIPALIEGLNYCKNYIIEDTNRDLEDIGNQYPWFRTILKAHKRLHGLELMQEDFMKLSISSFAQELLGKPLGTSLEKLVAEIKNIDRGNDND